MRWAAPPSGAGSLCEKTLAQNLEDIRGYAAAGGDAIYIDDACAASDMISPAMYERFSLPYMKALVGEIRRQVEAGGCARGFIVSTASPITPATPPARVQRFIELARTLGASHGDGMGRG